MAIAHIIICYLAGDSKVEEVLAAAPEEGRQGAGGGAGQAELRADLPQEHDCQISSHSLSDTGHSFS
jgi:hypothetical protein